MCQFTTLRQRLGQLRAAGAEPVTVFVSSWEWEEITEKAGPLASNGPPGKNKVCGVPVRVMPFSTAVVILDNRGVFHFEGADINGSPA